MDLIKSQTYYILLKGFLQKSFHANFMPQNVSYMCSLNIHVLWTVFPSWKKKSGKALYRNLNILMYFFSLRVMIKLEQKLNNSYYVQHFVNPFTETFITTPRFLKRNTMATMFEALFKSVLLMWSCNIGIWGSWVIMSLSLLIPEATWCYWIPES